jgi:hypothetical protein
MRRVRQITDADLLYDSLTTGKKIVVPDGWELAEDENSRACFVSRPSCATCLHAHPTDSAWLVCERDLEGDSRAACGIVSGSHVALDRGAASLLVAPTFGCVQWEGK